MNQDRSLATGWRNDVPDFSLLVRRALGALRRNVAVLILGSALGGALAAGLAATKPDVYYSTAAILIDPRLGGSGDAAAAPTIYLADALVVDSEIEVLRSERLLRRVLEKLRPQAGAAIPAATDEAGAPLPPQEQVEAQIEWMARNLTVERQGNTFVIVIGFKAEDPQLAAAVANAVAQEYVLSQQDDSRSRVQQESDWLSSEIARLSSKARDAEAAVQQFLVQNDVPKDGQTGLVGATMNDVEAEIVDQQRVLRQTTLFMDQIDADLRRLESDQPVGELLSLRPDNATLSRLMQQYKDARLSDAGNEAVLARLTGQIRDELSSMREANRATRAVTEANLAKLEARHADLQSQLSQIAATQIELGNLQRESEAVQEQQRHIMSQLQQSQSQDLYVVSNTRVIDDAIPPTTPANASLALILASGILGGLLLSMAWVFARAQMDDRIRDPQALRDRLGLPYLGSVPPRPFRAKTLTRPDLLSSDRSANGRQLYDTLRRASVMLRRDRGITLVTSPSDSHSRALLSASLAAFLIGQGNRVLLIEGDPTGRRLSGVLGKQLGDLTPTNATISLAQPAEGLTVAVPSAARDVDAVRYGEAISAMLAERRNNAEIVIIDGPHLSGATDEILHDLEVDRVLMALPFGKISLHSLGQVLDRNQGVGRRIVGIFLTDVRQRRLRRHDLALSKHTA